LNSQLKANGEKPNVIGQISEAYAQNPIIRALLQVFPGGGSADTLLQQRAAEIAGERLRTFFSELANGTRDLTEESIANDDFLHCFFSTMRAVTHTKRAQKIRLFAKLLSSQAHGRFSDTDYYEEVLSIIDSLSTREFEALNLLRSFEVGSASKHFGNELQRAENHWNVFESAACLKLSIPEGEFDGFMTRLEHTGLYHEITGTYYDYAGGVGRTTRLFSRLLNLLSSESKNHA
jgi:hypothetical protein